MSDLDSIVTVSISAEARAPTAVGFGRTCIMTYHARFVDQYRIYASLTEMTADGWASYDEAYRLAAIQFSQTPRPENVVVGRLPAAPTFVTTLTLPNPCVVGQILKVSVIDPATGTNYDHVYTAASTVTDTVGAAIELELEALASGFSTAYAANVISFTPTTAGRKVHVYGLQTYTTVEETTAAAGYDTELSALQANFADWFFVVTDSASAANVAAVATWTVGKANMYFVSTSSTAVTAGTPLASYVTNKNVVVLYAPSSHTHAAAAWCGYGGAKTPGAINWAHKTLANVTARTLTTTLRNNITTDNENTYETLHGKDITYPAGVCGDGEFIDVVHGIYALTSAIQEAVFGLLTSSDSVPMTDQGFDLIASAILGAMKGFEGTAQNPGLIVEGTSYVTMPKAAAVSNANKALRRVSGIKFFGDLAGAVNSTSIAGTLST